jgi:hypothetical protein
MWGCGVKKRMDYDITMYMVDCLIPIFIGRYRPRRRYRGTPAVVVEHLHPMTHDEPKAGPFGAFAARC